MRVLNVNYTLDLVSGGGTAERTSQISRSLAKAGVECDILTLAPGLTAEQKEELAGVRVIALPRVNERYHVPKFSIKQILDTIKSADIVHIMGHWTFINALVYLLVRLLRKPYVVCPAGALPIYGRSKHLKRFYNKLIGRSMIRNADGHVAIAGNELPQFEAYGVRKDRVTLIPNGINKDDYPVDDGADFRGKYAVGDNPFILFVGRLSSIKGPDLLLRAFCRAKDGLTSHHLVFAGPDEGMLSELQRIAREFGVEDRVHFIGYLGGVAKAQAYNAAKLLVVPSRQEAMSIVALEAGITGTPVLLTDQCGFDEVARVNGGRVVPASVEGLQTGLVEMLEDPAELKQTGENLQQFLGEHYTWDSVVRKYLVLYERILGKVA